VAYPNPVIGTEIMLNTNTEGPYRIQLYSIDGKLAASTVQSNTPSLRINQVSAGIYIVRFEGKNYINYQRVIVK
jgi:hypothetical protein